MRALVVASLTARSAHDRVVERPVGGAPRATEGVELAVVTVLIDPSTHECVGRAVGPMSAEGPGLGPDTGLIARAARSAEGHREQRAQGQLEAALGIPRGDPRHPAGQGDRPLVELPSDVGGELHGVVALDAGVEERAVGRQGECGQKDVLPGCPASGVARAPPRGASHRGCARLGRGAHPRPCAGTGHAGDRLAGGGGRPESGGPRGVRAAGARI